MARNCLNKEQDLNNVEAMNFMSMVDHTALKPITILDSPGNFGSSSSRSNEQSKAALDAALHYIVNVHNDILAFTDGSALKNPGPCGAGAVIHWCGITSQATFHKKSISSKSNSYHGELQAILLALQIVCDRRPVVHGRTVHVLTDCQSALQAVAGLNAEDNYGSVIRKIQHCVNDLATRNVLVNIKWIAGHINLSGNDAADYLAKQAATNAIELDCNEPLSVSEAKSFLRRANLCRWQKRWNNDPTGRFTYDIIPCVKEGKYKSIGSRATEVKFNRLRTGFTLLNVHMNRILPEIYTSPNCDCGQKLGTVEHFLTECILFKDMRVELYDKIERIFQKNNTPTHKRIINKYVLLGQSSLPQKIAIQIHIAVASFIRATGVDI